jgi:hypothetical protein
LNQLNNKCLETSKSSLKKYSDPELGNDFLEFKNIILEEKLSNKYKNGHKNREALGERNFSLPFLNLLDNVASEMVFLNSKKSFPSFGIKGSLRTDLEI